MTTTATKIVNTGVCAFCTKPGSVEMTYDQYERYIQWKNARGSSNPHTHIQVLLHDLDAGQREQLINGTHGPCFDALFPPEEDE